MRHNCSMIRSSMPAITTDPTARLLNNSLESKVDRQLLERYLHQHIPLSKSMAVAVVSADPDEVRLQAPLAPNINHRETVFGGSASAVAILSAWTLLHLRLTQQGITCRVVIHRNTMNYTRPIAGDFIAVSGLDDAATWDRFVDMLRRKGRARITVRVRLLYQDEPAGELVGDFVALGA